MRHTLSRRHRSLALVVGLVVMSACAKPPVVLSPLATTAWHETRLIKGLDVVRDTAIDANAQIPPLVAEADTRKVVTYHRSALLLIDAGPGWPAKVMTGLDELVKDLPPSAAQLLAPYVALVKTLIQEITP